MPNARLILLRHGESVWNKEERFTGWMNADLSAKGIQDAHIAGRYKDTQCLLLHTGILCVHW